MKIFFSILVCLIGSGSYAQTPEIILPEGHHAAVYDGTFSADSKLVLTRATDGSVMLWSTVTGKLIKNFNTGNDWVRNGTFPSDSKKLILSKSSGIEILNTADLTTIAKIGYAGKTIYSATVSKDGNWLICLSDEYTVKILNLKTGKWIGELHHKGAFISDQLDDNYLPIGKLFKGQITSLHITPDGKTIITATKEGDCKFWDIATGKIIFSVNVGNPVTAINISPIREKSCSIYNLYYSLYN